MEIYDTDTGATPDVIEEMLLRLDSLETAKAVTLVDQYTGETYTVYVYDGKLMMDRK